MDKTALIHSIDHDADLCLKFDFSSQYKVVAGEEETNDL